VGGSRTLKEYLQGQRTVSVEFILDYLNIGFDEYKIYLFNWPTIFFNGETIRKNDRRYRDCICFVIGSTVITAEDIANDHFSIGFDCDVSLRIGLASAERAAPDIAILYDKKLTELMAW